MNVACSRQAHGDNERREHREGDRVRGKPAGGGEPGGKSVRNRERCVRDAGVSTGR